MQYPNVDESPDLYIPGAVGVKSRDVFDAPFTAGFLELFAIPVQESARGSAEQGGRVRMRAVAGLGYGEGMIKELLGHGVRALRANFQWA